MDVQKKKRGRNKMFKSCFRPDGAGDDDCYPNSEDALDKPILIAVGGKRKILLPDGNSVVPVADGDDAVGAGRPYDPKLSSSSRRRISRLFKAVLFDTAVLKKMRSRRSSKNSIASNMNLSFDQKNKYSGNYSDTDCSSNRHSNLFSSSSRTLSSSNSLSCTSSMSNWRSLSERNVPSSRINSLDRKLSMPTNLPQPQKQNHQKKIGGYHGSTNGLCLFLLLSLFVLVVWGRISAIFCTSTWLYLGPCRRVVHRVESSTNVAESTDIDSEQYRKRVIMEGLLDRSRNQGR